MNVLNAYTLHDILLIAVAYLGIPAGMLLAYLTKEELKPGKKYFLLICNACLIAIFITALYFSWTNFLLTTAFLIAISFIKNKYPITIYIFLFVIMFLNIKENFAYLLGIFIFIFLLASVALERGRKK